MPALMVKVSSVLLIPSVMFEDCTLKLPDDSNGPTTKTPLETTALPDVKMVPSLSGKDKTCCE